MLHYAQGGEVMEKLVYNKAFRSAMIALVFFILLSFALIAPPVVSKIQYDNLVANMEPTQATIIDIDLDISVRGPDVQEIYIIYEVDGIVYNRELSTDTGISFEAGTVAAYSIGDTVDIFYNPQNPNEIATPRSVAVGYGFMALGLIVLALVIVGFVAVMKKRRNFLVTQEEYEREKHERKNEKLLSKSGKKIRWQYFNTYIYLQLSLIPAVPVMIMLTELKKGNFDIWSGIAEMAGAIPVLLVMYGILIGPFIILSILNRFCFGKVLAVVDDSTLLLKDREMDINNITEIAYHPKLRSRSESSSCYATFVMQSKNGDTESFDVAHFPLYGLKEIKKRNPNIKLSFDNRIWFLVLCPTIIFSAIGLLFG